MPAMKFLIHDAEGRFFRRVKQRPSGHGIHVQALLSHTRSVERKLIRAHKMLAARDEFLAALKDVRLELLAAISTINGVKAMLVIGERKLYGLSVREQQIFEIMKANPSLGDKEIAAKLNIQRGTVKYHIHHILSKAGVSSRREL